MTDRATLVTDVTDALPVTSNRECDARTALSRGLAEYLSDQSLTLPDGRLIKFERVYDNYADLEDTAEYPSAAVYSEEDGSYGGGTESPLDPAVTVIEDEKLATTGTGYTLVSSTELVQAMLVEVWATDAVQRGGFGALLEDALMPVDWMSGFILTLPFYFNLRAVYEMPDIIRYVDNDGDRARRYYRVLFRVRGRVVVSQLRQYNRLVPQAQLDVL